MNRDTSDAATMQDIRDLAAALETTIAAILIRERDAESAQRLLQAAQAMAAAIARGEAPPFDSDDPHHDA
jgi:DNA-binding GntR family transcriptional regulator